MNRDPRDLVPSYGQYVSEEDKAALKKKEDGERKEARKEEQSKWFGTIVGGLALIALGFAITAGTYWFAGPGETYYVTGGAFIIGAFLVLKGIYHRIRWW